MLGLGFGLNRGRRVGGFVGLLDQFPDAAAAYSLRKLRKAYTGAAVRVRESGGNTEADIGFLADGTLDTTALLAHCGANNGFVSVCYDQSGNGNDAIQATSTNQPKIVSSGALVEENGNAAIEFDGIDDLLTISAGSSILPSTGDISSFVVFSGSTSVSGYLYANRTSSNDRHGLGLQFFSGALRINGAVRVGGTWSIYEEFLANANQQYLVSAFKEDVDMYVDGSKTVGSLNGLFASNSSSFNIGANTNDLNSFDGVMQEIVLFSSNEIGNRTGIEANINDYYNIY